MKLDFFEIRGKYELKNFGIIETINRVFYEDGDLPSDVTNQMVIQQAEIKSQLETADNNAV